MASFNPTNEFDYVDTDDEAVSVARRLGARTYQPVSRTPPQHRLFRKTGDAPRTAEVTVPESYPTTFRLPPCCHINHTLAVRG